MVKFFEALGPKHPATLEGRPDQSPPSCSAEGMMPDFATSLPSRFPIFPLRGAMLLPGGNLPLNIFEPRYLQMAAMRRRPTG